MTVATRIESFVTTPGASHQLNEPTALTIWSLPNISSIDTNRTKDLWSLLSSLWPSEPLYGVNLQEGPESFLVPGAFTSELAAWGIALAIVIQRLARDPVARGRIVGVKNERVLVALPFRRADVAKQASGLALDCISASLLSGAERTSALMPLRAQIEGWLPKVQSTGLPPNTFRFAMAGLERDIPIDIRGAIVSFGWGAHTELMDSSFTGRTSNIASRIARQKTVTTQLLRNAGIPVPRGAVASSRDQAQRLAAHLGFPVVIKPTNQDQGLGVVPGIRQEPELLAAFDAALKLSPRSVIVEKHIEGKDHRMLVVKGRLLMSTMRIPAGVWGDGVQSVSQLVDQINADPLRGSNKRNLLITIQIDAEAESCLAEQGVSLLDIPDPGQFVYLRRTANISTGGTAVDVSESVHPDNRLIAERAARLVGLDIAGVDFICPDIARSWREVGGAICEVNAQPGFRPHWLGDPKRDINGEIIDTLFCNKPLRIPVVAVAQGKSSRAFAEHFHQFWLGAGRQAGVSMQGGVWTGQHLALEKAQPGFAEAQLLLREPTIEAAILELSTASLARDGHPCDRYDVVVVLDDQSPDGNPSKTQKAASLQPELADLLLRARSAAVLNADSPQIDALLACTHARKQILVSSQLHSATLTRHLVHGGIGFSLEWHWNEFWLVMHEGSSRLPLRPLASMRQLDQTVDADHRLGVLAVLATAWALGFDPHKLRHDQ